MTKYITLGKFVFILCLIQNTIYLVNRWLKDDFNLNFHYLVYDYIYGYIYIFLFIYILMARHHFALTLITANGKFFAIYWYPKGTTSFITINRFITLNHLYAKISVRLLQCSLIQNYVPFCENIVCENKENIVCKA